ncbi:MAG: C39 family peptidase [Anaerolineales bacterium]|nr:C39 family peptidase [Anaerolineales bacterium]
MKSIPYKSQEDSDALMYPGDCGATSVAMILEAFGNPVSTNEVFRKSGAPANQFLSREDLIRAANAFGVRLKRFEGWGYAEVKRKIDEGKPIIALVNYGAWSALGSGVETQSRFSGPHFLVIQGYQTGNPYKFILHDPLWWGSRREEGASRIMDYSHFRVAWSTAHNYFGNPDYAGLYCQEPVPRTDCDDELPLPPVAPQEICTIKAWQAYHYKIIQSNPVDLSNPKVARAYLGIMGNWGEQFVNHKVSQSDDLGLIALKYYNDPLKWKVITLYNDLPPVDAFKINQVLRIPSPDMNFESRELRSQSLR